MEQLSNKLQAAIFPLSIFQNNMQPDTCNDHIIKIALTSEHNHTVLVLTHCCYVINTNIALHKPWKEAKVAKVQFGEAALMFSIDDLSREPVNINWIRWTLQPTIDISSKIAVDSFRFVVTRSELLKMKTITEREFSKDSRSSPFSKRKCEMHKTLSKDICHTETCLKWGRFNVFFAV